MGEPHTWKLSVQGGPSLLLLPSAHPLAPSSFSSTSMQGPPMLLTATWLDGSGKMAPAGSRGFWFYAIVLSQPSPNLLQVMELDSSYLTVAAAT